jgi:transcription factor-like protein
MANRLVLDLGLNVHSNAVTGTSILTPDEVHLRRQIYWALYCNDKLWASYSGRVCTMLASSLSTSALPLLMSHQDSQAAVPLPSLTSADEMPGQDRRRHLIVLQHAMATHCHILEKILTHLYVCLSPR